MSGDEGTLRRLLRDGDLRAYYLAFAALAFVWEVYGRALPLLFEQVGLSLALLGVARSAGSALALVAEPVSGLLADRVDRAAMAAVAGVVLGAVLGSLSVARSAPALVALVALAPPTRQFVTNAVTPAVDAAVEDGAEGRGWALRDVGLYGGSALGVGVAGAAVAATRDVGAAFVPLFVVSLVAGAALWCRRAGDAPVGTVLAPVRESDTPVGAVVISMRDALAGAAPLAAFREVSDWSVLARLCVVEALAVLGAGMSLFLLPAYAVVVGVPAGAVLFLFAAYNLLAAPVSLYGGGLADRRSRKWLYVANYGAEAAMLLGFALAAGVPVPGVEAAVGVPLFAAGLALYVAQTAFEPAVLAYFFDQFAEGEAGRAWSVEGVVAKAAGVVAPAAGGALYGVAPRLPFLVGGVLMAGATLVAVTLPD
jgi:MFS family permease